MEQSVVDFLIEKFGSQEALARAAGVKQPSVAGWRKRGVVPFRRVSAILNAADARGLGISPGDFFQRDSDERVPAA